MTFRVAVLVAAVAVAAALPALPARAQRPGSVEIGAFTGYANYDNSLPLGNTIGFGGRVGVHVLSVLSVEGDVARASKNGAKNTTAHAWLVYNVPPVTRAEIIVGAGYVKTSYTGSYDADDSGIAGFVGVRDRITDMLAFRIDGHTDFIAQPANKSQTATFNGNWGVQVGVSVLLNRAHGGP